MSHHHKEKTSLRHILSAWSIALFVTLCLAVPSIVFLLQNSDYERGDEFPTHPAIYKKGTISNIAVEMTPYEENELKHFSAEFRTGRYRLFSQTKTLSLLIATYHGAPLLHSAYIKIPALGCVFKADSPQPLQDNTFLQFKSETICSTPQKTTPLRLQLHITTDSQARLALWSRIAEPPQKNKLYGITYSTPQHGLVFPIGQSIPLVLAQEKTTNLTLLTAMWGFPRDQHILPWLLIISFVLCFVGLGMILNAFHLKKADRKRLGIGFFCVVLGLASTYATLMPPFHAPDEPYHFISFTRLNQRPQLEKEALTLANQGHFERLKFRAGEKFTTQDLGQPSTEKHWEKRLTKKRDDSRHPLVTHYWKLADNFLQDMSASTVLLLLRLMNSLIFALAFTCGIIWVIRHDSSEGYSRFIPALSYAIIPTLAFFAMHVSNYATFTSLFLLQSFFLLRLFQTPQLRLREVLGLAIIIGCSLLTTRNAIACLALWTIILPLKLALHSYSTQNRLKEGVLLALFFITIAGIFFGFSSHDFILVTQTSFNKFATYPLLSWLSLHTFFATLAILSVALFAFYSAVLRYGRSKDMTSLQQKISFALLIILIAVIIAGTWKGPIDPPDIEITRTAETSLRKYLYYTLKSLVFDLGFQHPSGHITASFWRGFGWLEIQLPSLMLLLLKYIVSFGFVSFCIISYKNKINAQTFSLFFMSFIGLLIYFLLLSFGAYQVRYNLHGRYLIGFHLFYITLAFQGWRIFLDTLSSQTLREWSYRVLFICPIIVHSLSWVVILRRFFI